MPLLCKSVLPFYPVSYLAFTHDDRAPCGCSWISLTLWGSGYVHVYIMESRVWCDAICTSRCFKSSHTSPGDWYMCLTHGHNDLQPSQQQGQLLCACWHSVHAYLAYIYK